MIKHFFTEKVRQISNLTFVITLIASSYAAKIIGVGLSLEESAKYFPTVLIPAPYTFSIWFIIFAGLLAYGFFQSSQKHASSTLLKSIGLYTALAFLLITVWMFATQLYDIQNLDFIFSSIILYLLIIAFRIINERVKILSNKEYLMVYIPISVLTGWMTVVVMLTIASALKYTEINNFGMTETFTGSLLLLFSTIFALTINFFNMNNIFYILTIVWGMIGIILRNIAINANLEIVFCSCICSIILVGSLVVGPRQRVKNKNIFRK